jgi:hypothetical protein
VHDLSSYDAVICVAGSRTYHNVYGFDAVLRDYLSWLGIDNYVLVSGGAYRGADRLCIEWAKLNNRPCAEFLADWDALGRGAGFIRNAQMREVSTHLLAFWDGLSSGTEEMIEKSMEQGLVVAVQMVESDGWKPKPYGSYKPIRS